MATSAKRYGLDVGADLELELRLRRIEQRLEQVSLVGDFGDGSSDTQRVSIIPQVEGLRVKGQTPGAVTVAWNQVRISDLRRYELDVATNLAFTTNKQTFNLAGTEFNFSTASITGGGGNTAVFARVRARSRNGNVGLYSTVLNTLTGQAQNPDIADSAVENDNLDNSVLLQLALRGYIDGFRLANNSTDPANDIDIGAGVSRDALDSSSINLVSLITKRIDATWAEGTNQGGFPDTSLNLTSNTDYRVFIIATSDTTSNDAGFDTSATAANLISDMTDVDSKWSGAKYLQVGWIKYISGASGIRRCFWPAYDPELCVYDSDLVSTSVTQATSQRLITMDAPPDVAATYAFWWKVANGSDATFYSALKPTAATDAAVSVTNFTRAVRRENETDDWYLWYMVTELDSSSQLQARFSAATGTAEVITQGFIFTRGRNA